MKRLVISALMSFALAVASPVGAQGPLEIKGQVIDQETKRPIPQCNIYIKNSHLGTITNNSGRFSLKIPSELSKESVVASRIGYRSQEMPLNDISGGAWRVQLQTSVTLLNEVVIQDVETILRTALDHINDNYPTQHLEMTSFYRELVQKNRKYVDVSQGVINISKTPYEEKVTDGLSIIKGSRSQRYHRDDTLAFRVMGGPNVMLLLDVVKHPGLVIDRQILDKYDYSLRAAQMIDGRRNYVIDFSPSALYNVPLYSGVIYIDEESLAISGLEFGYDEANLRLAAANMIKKKPLFVKVKPLKIRYEVKYRETNGLWYLDYVRNEMTMRCNWKHKLFNSTFSAVSELVVTEKNQVGEDNQSSNGNLLSTDLFSERVSAFQDPNFWEDYSIIEPEEDLRKALARIDRRREN